MKDNTNNLLTRRISTEQRKIVTTKKRPNSKSNINNITNTNKRTIQHVIKMINNVSTHNFLHQDHHVLFVKLIRNIYQQVLCTFQCTYLVNGRDVI